MKKEVLNITLEVFTGLHIGAGNDAVQIGGVDSAVIKDPVTQLPYIPGSSLKGKLRCLLETEGGYGEEDETLNKYFGPNTDFLRGKKDDKNFEQTPTRLIFRDLFLSTEDEQKFQSGEWTTETKTEIVIDRNKGTAKDGGLRTIERVPPQAKFVGQVLIRHFDGEVDDIKTMLKKGIDFLNNDYLGGSGSRGYGAVKVTLT
ncbi:MAG: type III-A CRISPR-associated RAMP protein Csm3 [Bacteroidetes bacterium]|nr:type III-A CRISPR-associated RAMP protein Csm3 [Bacteroidota bacterium]MBU2584308.1 type III-A CRISPR-associated RAMP protein Csm3 [Bacteroidota bacterium]